MNSDPSVRIGKVKIDSAVAGLRVTAHYRGFTGCELRICARRWSWPLSVRWSPVQAAYVSVKYRKSMRLEPDQGAAPWI